MSTETTAVRYRTFNFKKLDQLLGLLSKDNPAGIANKIMRSLGIPAVAVGIFLMLWSVLAAQVQTSLGVLPGPAKVWEQTMVLVDEHKAERVKEAAFNIYDETTMQDLLDANETLGAGAN